MSNEDFHEEDSCEEEARKLPEILSHRDDLPFPVAEAITNYFQERFPGVKVRFAGDIPEGEIPAEIFQEVQKTQQKIVDSMVNGTCVDCNKKMPGDWPPSEGSPFPAGWSWCESGEFTFFICPECDARTPHVDLTPGENPGESD